MVVGPAEDQQPQGRGAGPRRQSHEQEGDPGEAAAGRQRGDMPACYRFATAVSFNFIEW